MRRGLVGSTVMVLSTVSHLVESRPLPSNELYLVAHQSYDLIFPHFIMIFAQVRPG